MELSVLTVLLVSGSRYSASCFTALIWGATVGSSFGGGLRSTLSIQWNTYQRLKRNSWLVAEIGVSQAAPHPTRLHQPHTIGLSGQTTLIVYFGGHDLNPDAIVHQPPADKTEPDHSLTAYLWPSIPDYLHSAPPQAISKSCVILVPYISLRLLLAGQPLLRTPFQHRSPTICIMVRIIYGAAPYMAVSLICCPSLCQQRSSPLPWVTDRLPAFETLHSAGPTRLHRLHHSDK